MKNIILLSPLTGNGGIASWSRKFIKTFHSDDLNIIPIDRSITGRKFEETSIQKRFVAGIKELRAIRKKVKDAIKEQPIDILHATTSGSFGTFRDYSIARLCKCKCKINIILHLRYGCVTEDLQKPLFGKFLLKTMSMYDQVWVLDKRSESTLNQYNELRGKVFLTPNSINVCKDVDIKPKSYKHIAFIGNLVPTKGLFELVKAVLQVKYPITLSIVGNGEKGVIEEIKCLAGNNIERTVRLLGQLPNEEAVAFMNTVDIVALPSYMPREAFPISILEAMSLGKLVISTHRAAISDMLTGLDGKPCGCFVEEHSVEDITNAIEWAIENSTEADVLCKKAYEKVYSCYRTEVVYKLYESLYQKML